MRAVSSGLVALATTLAATAAAAGPVMVKRDVTVDGKMVRLGDLFTGVGGKAEAPVVQAPKAGQRIRLDADWLRKVSAAYGLDWEPTSSHMHVEVTRATQTLGTDAIKNAIRTSLKQKGLRGNYTVKLDNHGMKLTLPASAPATIRVTKLRYRQGDGRFTAGLAAPAGGRTHANATVSGGVVRRQTVPVPASDIARGETVQKGDIKRVERRRDRVPSDTVTSMKALVGKEVTRRLSKGRLVRRDQVREPVVVTENSRVTLRVETGAMRLSARGRALENGARGDRIRVLNTMSKNTVVGTVVSSNTIAVQP